MNRKEIISGGNFTIMDDIFIPFVDGTQKTFNIDIITRAKDGNAIIDKKTVYNGKTESNSVFIKDILTNYINYDGYADLVNGAQFVNHVGVVHFSVQTVQINENGQRIIKDYEDCALSNQCELFVNYNNQPQVEEGLFGQLLGGFAHNWIALKGLGYAYSGFPVYFRQGFINNRATDVFEYRFDNGNYTSIRVSEYSIVRIDVPDNVKRLDVMFRSGDAYFLNISNLGCEYNYLTYVNMYGGLNTVYVNEASKDSVNVDRKTFVQNGKMVNYNNYVDKSVNCKTIRMNDTDYDLIRGLLMSKNVFYINKGKKQIGDYLFTNAMNVDNVIVDTNSVVQKRYKTDGAYGYEFTIKKSNKIEI